MQLVARFVINANKNGCHLPVVVEEGWTARPLNVRKYAHHGVSVLIYKIRSGRIRPTGLIVGFGSWRVWQLYCGDITSRGPSNRK